MSYTYLQEQGEASSVDTFSGIPASVLSNSNLIAAACCCSGNAMECCPDSPSGTTCEHSTADRGGDVSIACAQASHVKTYLQQEQTAATTASSEELMALVLDYGSKLSELLKKYNLNMCCLRTPQTYGLKDSGESWKDLPTWGMMLGGECWGFASSVRTMPGSECLSSLPTPTCHNAKEGAYPAEYTRNTPTLAAQIGGKVNPDWNEWRMGWPIGWTDLKPLEMVKFQQWRHSHGGC